MLTKLNNDEKVNGIIVQLPLPAHIESDTIINIISPIKDIDGFTAVNIGKVVLDDESGLPPCTPS
jgi:methylenetetrahydrofolate dehydrogenase (NADP+)/methenyltetrahydrofolate cyclohydrolase